MKSPSSTAGAVKNADVVFEAAPEKMALKQKIFSEIEEHAPERCILASNTSVMPITEIMSGLRLKSRALGTHWWNPPHMIPLVEVVKTEWTEPNVADRIMDLLSQVGTDGGDRRLEPCWRMRRIGGLTSPARLAVR